MKNKKFGINKTHLPYGTARYRVDRKRKYGIILNTGINHYSLNGSKLYADAQSPIIIFNGILLPESAYFIDVCSDKVLKNTSKDIALWFWHFTICLGRTREEKSEKVIRYADYLLNRILSAKEKVKRKTDFLYSNYHSRQKSEKIVNEWIQALNIIRLSAEKCTLCKWYAIFNTSYFSDERKQNARLQ